MGVDFYSCSRCGEVYCDCGHYVTCDEDAGGCGRDWCSDRCAEGDGYVPCSCKLGNEVDCNGYAEYDCDLLPSGRTYCHGCENFVEASCSHCRKEAFSDDKILEYALCLLNKTKADLIFEMRNI